MIIVVGEIEMCELY